MVGSWLLTKGDIIHAETGAARLTAVMSWRPESEMVRNGRFMAVNKRRNYPRRICLKRCHCLNHPVMLGLRVVACPVSQATNGKASHSHRAPQGVIAQQRVGQVRVQLLDQVEVGSMLMDERTECLVVHRWIG